MTVRTNTLNVTQQTSIEQLRGFLDRAGDNSRIRGEKLADGSVRLYSKPDKTGFMARLSSLGFNARQHREIGRDAIKQIFANQPRKAGETLNAGVRSAVDPGFARDMKAGAIKLLGTIAAKTELRTDGMDVAAEQHGRPSPKLADLGLSDQQLDALVQAGADAVKQGGDAVTAGAALGRALATAFDATKPSAEARENFAFSLGGEFKDELLVRIQDLMLPDSGLAFENLPKDDRSNISNMAASAFNAAASSVLPDKMADNGELTLGGKTYTRVTELGKGGLGTVDLYVNRDDASDKIAVKVPNLTTTGSFGDDQDMIVEGFKAGLTEMDAHKAIEAGGHENVVALRGAVRCPNGGIAIALELCEAGDLKGMTKALDDAAASGAIPPDRAMAAKATLAKDYLQGVAHIHGQGMANRDLKPDNMFITQQGTLKVGDQGGGRSVAVYNARSQDSQTAQYIAPEVSVGSRTVLQHLKAALFQGAGGAATYVKRDEVRQLIDRQMPNLSGAQKAALLQSYEGAVAEDVLAQKFDPRKRDLYAVGGSLLALVRGQNIQHGRSNFEITAALQDDYDNPDRDVVQNLGTGTRTGPSWTAANVVIRDFNDLANQLMKTDPLERMSATDALQHPLFQNTPGIDSDQARADIRLAAAQASAPATPPVQGTQAPPVQGTQAPPPLTGASDGASAQTLPLLRTSVDAEDADDMLASIARERSASLLI